MFQGSLFTRDFLIEGVVETDAWQALDDSKVDTVRTQIAALLDGLVKIKNPTEAVTEKDLIYPVLSAIGWGDLVFVQPNLSKKGRSDVPDALLFGGEKAHDLGKGEVENWLRFQHGRCLVEAKRWNRILDREDKRDREAGGVPSTQMLRYLRRCDDITQGGLRWGILTNGRHWRLYWQGALSVAEDFFEIDLGKVFDLADCELDLLDKRPEQLETDAAWRKHGLRLFLLFFGRNAFEPDTAGKTFHDLAVAQGRFWEERVARDLSIRVFDEVFPRLAEAIAASDPQRDTELGEAYLEEVRQGALVLLYRLLFVLYAEDRNLLPDESGPYRPYSLTVMRVEIANKRERSEAVSERMSTYWPRLKAIIRAIAEGDDKLGIPPYNGGLFDPEAAPILERTEITDAILAEVIFRLSHHEDPKSPRAKYINYRDLSVQQLGSVYEQILEFGLRVSGDGRIEIAADTDARHKSGSYYTPEALVSLIIDRAVGSLVDERLHAFSERAAELASDTRPKQVRLAELAPLDPATGILSLRVVDPAMGSGHFLVSLVDWLADRVLAAMIEAERAVEWADYTSPLAARVEAVRETILQEARAHGWPIVEAQLDDRHVVRRMVLKRVVYGVDKNPMAVELAKVALWLHSFTVGAPLSFLDHHLRCGDSVVGAWVRPTLDRLDERGALFGTGQITRVEKVADLMAEIEETTDNDIAEVEASKAAFHTIEEVIEPVASFFSLLVAETLMSVFDGAPRKPPPKVEDLMAAKKSERAITKAREQAEAFERASALQLVLEGTFGDPIRIANGEERIASPELVERFALMTAEHPDPQTKLFPALSTDDRRRWMADRIVEEVITLSRRHNFFHWEIGFPNVWSNLASSEPRGGFDAVIGNPPYVRQELLGEIKPALKKAYAAYDGMADLYVYFYEQGLKLLKPGGRMSFVVTNKWLKAGYAEGLRGLFADPKRAEVTFLADFGHAKHFFPDADVFPSVLVVRKPGDHDAENEADICVIPREAVPKKNLAAAVAEATFPLPRAVFTKDGWTLEPKPVMDLLEKIQRNGVPLTESVGAKPYRGILTGLNEAFLIDTAMRDWLVRDDPACADIIKPYLRGQDIERWWSPPTGLHMIVMKSSGDHAWPWSDAADESAAEKRFAKVYPSLHGFMKPFEEFIDQRTGKLRGLRHRQDKGRFWWELRACAYYEAFEKPKLIYQEIQFYSAYSRDDEGRLGNNKTFFLPTNAPLLNAILNSPLLWWFSWRYLPHLKDEALSPMAYKMETMPIATVDTETLAEIATAVPSVIRCTETVATTNVAILDWLRHEFGLHKASGRLSEPHGLNADDFVAAVRASLPKRQRLSSADIARLKQEHRDTVEPARAAAAEILSLERKLSDLVNAAYGLTPEDVKLMWRTAPPRTPLDPTEELRRLVSGSYSP